MEISNKRKTWETSDPLDEKESSTGALQSPEQIVSNLIVWTTNADVLTRDKLIELKNRIELQIKPPDIISVTEFKPKYHKRELNILEYHIEGYVIEDNINNNQGRGIIIYVRDSLKYNPYEPRVKGR